MLNYWPTIYIWYYLNGVWKSVNNSFLIVSDYYFLPDNLNAIYVKMLILFCADIDECLKPNACGHSARCVNHAGNYTCSCPPGYQGNPYTGVSANWYSFGNSVECWNVCHLFVIYAQYTDVNDSCNSSSQKCVDCIEVWTRNTWPHRHFLLCYTLFLPTTNGVPYLVPEYCRCILVFRKLNLEPHILVNITYFICNNSNQFNSISFIWKKSLQRISKSSYSYTWSRLIC